MASLDQRLRAGKLIIDIDVNKHKVLFSPLTKKNPIWGISHALRALLRESNGKGRKAFSLMSPQTLDDHSVDMVRTSGHSGMHVGAQRGPEECREAP